MPRRSGRAGSLRRERILRVASLCVLGAVVGMAAARAEPERFQCAPLVASATRAPAYGPAAGQARCEGFYEKNVSQPFLELVSLTRAAPGSWAADAEGRLTLSAPARVDTRLVIQPMRSLPLYRVDAPLLRGASLAWNSAPMLQATGLRLRDLGLLALAGNPAELPTLVPVSTASADANAVAYAVLRPSVAVSSLAWRAYRIGAAAASSSAFGSGWQALDGTPLFAWERIALPIPLPADGLGLRIDVRGLDSQGQPLPMLQFALLGANDERP